MHQESFDVYRYQFIYHYPNYDSYDGEFRRNFHIMNTFGVKLRSNRHIEDDHQAAFFSWLHSQYPEIYKVTFAIPNGGKRNPVEAARLKKQGVKAGVSDIFVAYPENPYHGLWIELKRPKVKGQQNP